jgi:hypothetical protein
LVLSWARRNMFSVNLLTVASSVPAPTPSV